LKYQYKDRTAHSEFDTHRHGWVLLAALAVLTIFSVWAYYSKIDEVSRAMGTVIASSRTQVVQSQDGGTLDELFVSEGDEVVAGQLLARVDKTRAEASYLETRSQVAALSAKSSRLQAELFDSVPKYEPITEQYPEFVDNQNKLLFIRKKALEDELSAILKIEEIARKELEINMPLALVGDVSKTDILRLERQVADLEAQRTIKRNEYFRELQDQLSQTNEELTAMKELLGQREHILRQTEIRSPSNGIVKNVNVTTLYGVIKPGEEIMQIVPIEDDLLVEAKLSPVDIGFVSVGMKVALKIDAYDSSIYGTLPGELVFISADTISEGLKQGETAYYRIRIKSLGRQFSAKPDLDLAIQPGMTATAEIKTGERTVLQYLTKPIIKTLSGSMGER